MQAFRAGMIGSFYNLMLFMYFFQLGCCFAGRFASGTGSNAEQSSRGKCKSQRTGTKVQHAAGPVVCSKGEHGADES